MSENVNQQQELTQEQIAELKAKTLAFYRDRIPFMEVQLQFETLDADIEEAKLRAFIARLKMAQITNPPSEEDTEEITPEKEK
jgi:hypothetical protein